MAQLLSSNVTGTLNVTQNTAISGNLSISKNTSVTGNLFVSTIDIIPEINKYSKSLSNLNYDHVNAWYSNTEGFDYLADTPGISTGNPEGLFVKPDGTQLYVIDSNGDRVNQFKLTQAYNVASAVYEGNLTVVASESNPRDLFFSNTGTILYVIGSTEDAIDAHDLTTAWNVFAGSTLVAANGFSVSANSTQPEGIHFNSNGKFLYIISDVSGKENVYRYTLNTAWNVATANTGSVQTFNVTPFTTAVSSVSISNTGSKMYVLSWETDRRSLIEFNLPTPYDITTATYSGRSQLSALFNDSAGNAVELYPTAFFYEPTSNNVYAVGTSDDVIRSAKATPGTLVSNSLIVDGKLQTNYGLEVNRVAAFNDQVYFEKAVRVAGTFSTGSLLLSGPFADFTSTSIITHSGSTFYLGESTDNTNYNMAHGVTVSGKTKSLNIGTNGLVGSKTNIIIGPQTGANANITITANTTNISGSVLVTGELDVNSNVVISNVGGLYFGASQTSTTVATSKVSMAYNVATQSLDIVYLG